MDIFPKLPFILSDLVLWPVSFIDFLIGRRQKIQYESCQVYTIIGDSSPLLNPLQERKKHACFT